MVTRGGASSRRRGGLGESPRATRESIDPRPRFDHTTALRGGITKAAGSNPTAPVAGKCSHHPRDLIANGSIRMVLNRETQIAEELLVRRGRSQIEEHPRIELALLAGKERNRDRSNGECQSGEEETASGSAGTQSSVGISEGGRRLQLQTSGETDSASNVLMSLRLRGSTPPLSVNLA